MHKGPADVCQRLGVLPDLRNDDHVLRRETKCPEATDGEYPLIEGSRYRRLLPGERLVVCRNPLLAEERC